MSLINKYDFLEKLKASKYYCVNDEYKAGYNDGIFHAEVSIEHVPTVDAVPVDLINKIIKADGSEDQSTAITLLSLLDTWKYVKRKEARKEE